MEVDGEREPTLKEGTATGEFDARDDASEADGEGSGGKLGNLFFEMYLALRGEGAFASCKALVGICCLLCSEDNC